PPRDVSIRIHFLSPLFFTATRLALPPLSGTAQMDSILSSVVGAAFITCSMLRNERSVMRWEPSTALNSWLRRRPGFGTVATRPVYAGASGPPVTALADVTAVTGPKLPTGHLAVHHLAKSLSGYSSAAAFARASTASATVLPVPELRPSSPRFHST